MRKPAFAVGDRVQIAQTYHWAQGAIGTIGEHLQLYPSHECSRQVRSLQGMLTFYWVKFDDPQVDTEGDKYKGAEIDERYLVSLPKS